MADDSDAASDTLLNAFRSISRKRSGTHPNCHGFGTAAVDGVGARRGVCGVCAGPGVCACCSFRMSLCSSAISTYFLLRSNVVFLRGTIQ